MGCVCSAQVTDAAVVQDERRVVYVGQICSSMTHQELRQRFSQFGPVECVSLHFREAGSVAAACLFVSAVRSLPIMPCFLFL